MGWHPIKQARRVSDDELLMVDEWMGPWAVIRRLKFGEEVWYRAVTPESDRNERQLLGYSQDLRHLAWHAYRRFLHDRGINTGPVNGWGRDRAG